MRAIRLDQDVRSLSELRAGVAAFVQQVNETLSDGTELRPKVGQGLGRRL